MQAFYSCLKIHELHTFFAYFTISDPGMYTSDTGCTIAIMGLSLGPIILGGYRLAGSGASLTGLSALLLGLGSSL